MGPISRIIGYPLGWIMWLAYKICGNYALSIVIFTILMRLLIFPMSVKSQKNQASITALNPKLEKLKKQYANNPQKLQEAQAALYAEENVNPMASCLPLMIQFPLLYGIIDVVYRPLTHIVRIKSDIIDKAVEICKGIEEYAGIKSFSRAPEIYTMHAVKNPGYFSLFSDLGDNFAATVNSFDNTLFGFIDLGQTPSLHPDGGWTAGAIGLAVIGVLSGIFQLIGVILGNISNKKTNPEAAQMMGGMNAMMYMFPILSVWISFTCPGGLGFYWAVSSFITVIERIIFNKIYTPEYIAKLVEKDKIKNKNKKKSGLMQRYQEMLAQQTGMVEGTGRTVRTNDGTEEIKLSKSQQKEYERKIIAEARRRQAEKYGDEYDENDDGEI